MKKQTLGLVVAGIMAAPVAAYADATLYGSIRVGLNEVDGQDWQLTDEVSRIGIKGDVDLGLESTKGIFRFEARLRADNGTFAGDSEANARLAYAGAAGEWGTALAGRMWTPASLWTHMKGNGGFNDVQVNGNHNVQHRMPNTLAYVSPNMGGFQASAALVMGGSAGRIGDVLGVSTTDKNDEDVDAYSLAAKYAANGLHVGLQHTSTSISVLPGDYDQTTLAVAYKFDAVTLQALYNDEDNDTGLGSFSDVENFAVSAQYKMGATSFRAMYAEQDVDGTDNDRITLGVNQQLGKGRVWLEYADVDNSNGLKYGIGSADLVSIGYRVDF